MPIYEYRCPDFGHEFELMQKFSDPPVQQCPVCSGPVHKLISLSTFHLKGNGWYATDYAHKGSQNGKTPAESHHKGRDAKTPSDSTASTNKEGSQTAGSTSTSS